MSNLRYVTLFIGFLLASCAAPAIQPLPAATPAKGTLRIGFISEHNVSVLPQLLIDDALRKQGYDVTETVFESQDLAGEALARGQIDFSYGTPNAFWSAIQKGANFVGVANSLSNPYSIVVTQAIKTCADLDGMRYGIGSSSGANTFLSKEYIRQNCPEAVPQYLTIANSQARAAAMLADGLDATTGEIADMQELERRAPGKFHILADFAETFPNFKFGMVFANRDFVAKNPQVVKDFLVANIDIFRSAHTNPQQVYDAAVKYLGLSPEQAKTAVDPYLASGAWKVDQQNTRQAYQFTLDTLVGLGSLPAGTKLEDLADLSYLDQALADAP